MRGGCLWGAAEGMAQGRRRQRGFRGGETSRGEADSAVGSAGPLLETAIGAGEAPGPSPGAREAPKSVSGTAPTPTPVAGAGGCEGLYGCGKCAEGGGHPARPSLQHAGEPQAKGDCGRPSFFFTIHFVDPQRFPTSAFFSGLKTLLCSAAQDSPPEEDAFATSHRQGALLSARGRQGHDATGARKKALRVSIASGPRVAPSSSAGASAGKTRRPSFLVARSNRASTSSGAWA